MAHSMHYRKYLPRVRVQSRAVRSIGYDEHEWVLQVRLNDEKLYNYFRVPPQEHRALMRATSVGGYLKRYIEPYYAHEELETAEA